MALANPAAATRPRKTLEDLWALPPDTRAELIDGEIYMAPAPTPDHQRLVMRIAFALNTFVQSRRLGEVFFAPLDVVLPTQIVVEPDVLVVLAGGSASIEPKRIVGALDLAIEIVSESNPERDRIVKRERYAEAGVREYWIVEPSLRGIEVLQLDGTAYRSAGWFDGETTLRSPLLAGFELPVAPLFA